MNNFAHTAYLKVKRLNVILEIRQSRCKMYRILIVDDESIEREGISFLIEKYKLPLEVAQATNGKTALEYMRTHPIDILLTYVKMPQMDGLKLARHTFEKYPDVRILFIGSSSVRCSDGPCDHAQHGAVYAVWPHRFTGRICARFALYRSICHARSNASDL